MSNHQAINIALSDIGLPKLGGWDACVTMREIKPDMHIIPASGSTEPAAGNEMVAAGIGAIVEKPYVPDVILGNIREVMDKGRRVS
jgi:DNA-binding NarL/FixJ family response regulator